MKNQLKKVQKHYKRSVSWEIPSLSEDLLCSDAAKGGQDSSSKRNWYSRKLADKTVRRWNPPVPFSVDQYALLSPYLPRVLPSCPIARPLASLTYLVPVLSPIYCQATGLPILPREATVGQEARDGQGQEEGWPGGTGGRNRGGAGERRQEELSYCWTLLPIVNLQGGKGGEGGKGGGNEGGQDSHTQDTFVAGPYNKAVQLYYWISPNLGYYVCH